MALDKDAFLPAAFSKVQNSGKDCKVMEPATKQNFYKDIGSRDLENTPRIALYERFFVYILHP